MKVQVDVVPPAGCIHTSKRSASSCRRCTFSSVPTTVFALVLLTARRQEKVTVKHVQENDIQQKKADVVLEKKSPDMQHGASSKLSVFNGVGFPSASTATSLTNCRLLFISSLPFSNSMLIIIFFLIHKTKYNAVQNYNFFFKIVLATVKML